jgi:photosystem II stability/assembly factor-like uncharacterized protein
VAKDLPAHQVMQLAFSAYEPARGYASVFTDQRTPALYTTTDGGLSWRQAGGFSGPVGDFMSTDPLDAQDVVMVSSYAPMPGDYTFQRSLDGGKTWTPQSTTLTTTGAVSRIGWSGSTFLLGFALDQPLLGSSAVIAFPKGQASRRLDDNGKLNGQAIKHLRLLTGQCGRIQVWGDDGSQAQNTIGAATSDLGRTWTELSPPTIGGTALIPTAAADASAIVATSTDNSQFALSDDGGNTWSPQPAIPGRREGEQEIFVSTKGKTIVVSDGGGAYSLRNAAWSRITGNPVVCLSENGSSSGVRLWSYDKEGRTLWRDA